MKCPYCSSPDSRVINSRPNDDGASIRRRRECLSCARRFTTYERAQLEPLMVVKRSGLREAFNPDKLLRGLALASEKRPVDAAALRAFAYSFEDEVQSGEIPSEEIGRRAMTFLRPLDDVAYIRFASVYRDFDSLERFIEEIQGLKADEKTVAEAQQHDLQAAGQQESLQPEQHDPVPSHLPAPINSTLQSNSCTEESK